MTLKSCVITCACNQAMINSKTGCLSSRVVEKQAIVVNRTDSTGALNYIDLTLTLDDAYFIAKANEVDNNARWFFLPECKNITDVRDKSVMEAAKDGTMYKVRDGIRKFDGQYFPPFASPQLVGILSSQRCAAPCKFSIDANGTIWGRISEDGTKLYPMRMDAGSIDVIYVNPNDTEVEKVNYSYNLHPSEKDCEVRGIMASELTGGINPLDYTGLMDVSMIVVACNTTDFTFKLIDNFGTPLNPEAVVAFLAGDFALYNVTTSSAIPLTGSGFAFVESPAGTYKITYPTAHQPSSTDHLRLTPNKSGFDCTTIPSISIIVT